MGKANCIADVQIALATQVSAENVDPVVIGDALLGYVWMRFKREELQLFDCLCYAVSKAEDYPSSIDCRAIYSLLNNLRFDNEQQIVAESDRLFRDCKVQASHQWVILLK